MFKPVDSTLNVPALENEVLEFWDRHDIPAKYLRRNDASDTRWSFLDGPITANGRMGVHHAWGRTYKDLWQRYNTMLGHKQRYQNGFDCQGLWVEVTVERALGFKSKRDIERYGIAEFVRKCKESAFSFAAIQTAQSKRLGYFMDWDNSYFTLSDENNYTIWLFLKTCHEKGWLYKGRDVMPWCVRCGTGLSEHEINTTEYEELTHTSVYVKLPLVDRPGESLLVWTTTPWTLTSNVAAAVNPGADPETGLPVVYARVRRENEIFYLSEQAIEQVWPLASPGPGPVIEQKLSGADLLGWRYHGPFDDLPAEAGVQHRVIPWDQVSATEGTGIVHIAPGAGKEDFALGKAMTLPAIAPLDENGIYTDGFGWLTGRHVLEVADDIVDHLRKENILVRAHNFTHRYPVCWRCQTQLVFRLVNEWFISMNDLRHRMLEVAEKINWIPSWGLEREQDWLRNMDDWMISKKRYWGLALPIFECACGHVEVIGGKEELFARAVTGLENLESPHRPWLDDVRIRCSACGELVPRIKDVGNPWLDAGIVPFSTLGYGENREYWKEWFPADFITESFPGQFRNWFYSLIAQSAALENTNSFKTVLGYALLRDVNGMEMHKSWGNDIPFDEAANGVGADVMRWLFVNHPPESNLNFGYSSLDSIRARLLILWNTYSFFVTYANIDGFDPAAPSVPLPQRALLDRWIVARLHQLILTVRLGLDSYNSQEPARAIDMFVEDLSTWYVRRSRRRFWKSGTAATDADKQSAYITLFECLHTLCLLMAPFLPFIAESLYQNLVKTTSIPSPESVHLCDYPTANPAAIDSELISQMQAARHIVKLGRAAREQAQIRVRQPLAVIRVATPDRSQRSMDEDLKSIILDELNVKSMEPAEEGASYVDYAVRPNLPLLGKRFGRELPAIRSALSAMAPSQVVEAVMSGHDVVVQADERCWTLSPDEVLVNAVRKEGFIAAAEGGFLVALDTALTPELEREGLARELIRAVNEERKSQSLEISDRIRLRVASSSQTFREAVNDLGDYLRRETLANSIEFADELTSNSSVALQSGNEILRFQVERVSPETALD